MGISVDELLEIPFYRRNIEDKIRIVIDGKPRPFLNLSPAYLYNADGERTTDMMRFGFVMYENVPWLTGSDNPVNSGFYCWPCLLFDTVDPPWRVSHLSVFHETIRLHDTSPQHLQALSFLQKFQSEHIRRVTPRVDENILRQILRKNRDIFKLVIDVLCEVVKTPPLRSEPSKRINPNTCIKLLQLVHNYSKPNDKNALEAIDWIKLRSKFLDDLVDSIKKVLEARFTKEMESCSMVSLILNDHSTDPTHSQLSLVARYVKNGKVQERLLGFVNILIAQNPDVIYNIVLSLVKRFEISEKFVSCSFDGAIMETTELSAVKAMLENSFSNFYFVPHYDNGLYYVVLQSLSKIKDVGHFFKTLFGMETFFEKNCSQRVSFGKFLLRKEPDIRKWQDLPLLLLLKSYRIYFIEYLNSVSQSSNLYSTEVIVTAVGYRHFLSQFQTVFLLQSITALFKAFEFYSLANVLKSPNPELSFDFIASIIRSLYSELPFFKEIWEASIEEYSNSNGNSAVADYCRQKDEFSLLFIEIKMRLQEEIRIRCSSLSKLEFCCLLQKEHYIPNTRISTIPKKSSSYYLDLIKEKPNFFDADKLISELHVLRNTGVMFDDKDIYEVLEIITEADLANALEQFTKLITFTLTLPFKPPTSQPVQSKLQKIKLLGQYTNNMVVPGDTSVLNVESDFLQLLKNTDSNFYSDITTKYNDLNKTVEIIEH